MPNFSDLIREQQQQNHNPIEKIQELIQEIEEQFTQRPLIVYAADINKNSSSAPNLIYPLDKTMFADLLDSVGSSEHVDVLLQSPGGYPDATEQLVSMLRGCFKSVHFYIAHTAKSAATMMVCSGDKVFMDYRSELGPIDPQMRIPKAGGIFINVPAQAYLDGFDQVKQLVDLEGKLSSAYIPVLNQVDVSLLQVCQNAIDHSKALVEMWLKDYMFAGQPDAGDKASAIAHGLSDHRKFLSHGRPLGITQVRELGLQIEDLSETPELQAKIWELYCRIELMFDSTRWIKVLCSKNFMVGKLVPPQADIIVPRPQQQPKPPPAKKQQQRRKKRRR